MVGPWGLEPQTSTVSTRSNQLSYGPIPIGATSSLRAITPNFLITPESPERCSSTVSTRGHQVLTRLLGTAKYLIIPSSQTHLGLAIGLKNDTARNTQQGRQNHPTGSPNVGRQLQDTETGYGRKVAIIRKKSCAAGCQCRYNLQRIRRLDSRCGS